MGKDVIKIETIAKIDPFRVPEGYFEGFIADIMLKLPERPVENPKVISLWERVKPWVYMAAMFAGIALMLNLFAKNPNNGQDSVSTYASQGLNLTSSNDIEDFYHYYEDELTKIVYNDTIANFLGDVEIKDNYLNTK
ncbi:hypothetical protein AGMMS50239_18720 [Bacteroidia bacterium]|nr:hypothetical protein AGMMS50239_18720 [Bacteroidia bacterium]GHV33083.1 hypothetical protein FACS1894177_09520 [Bacteroidia bacterium]